MIDIQTMEETENIMENLMNRLVQSPDLLEDEVLNTKIEQFFDNQTFQKMVEKMDVFEEITHASFSNSFMSQKNISKNILKKHDLEDSKKMDNHIFVQQQNQPEQNSEESLIKSLLNKEEYQEEKMPKQKNPKLPMPPSIQDLKPLEKADFSSKEL